MRKFSITAVMLGLILIAGGMIPLAINVKTRMAATSTTLEVVSKRESTCQFRRKSLRRDPCAYPVVVHVDERGKKHFFELKPWRTEKLRWELKKSKNRLEVFYLPNSPSPDDDEIFESALFCFGRSATPTTCGLRVLYHLPHSVKACTLENGLTSHPPIPQTAFLLGKERIYFPIAEFFFQYIGFNVDAGNKKPRLYGRGFLYFSI